METIRRVYRLDRCQISFVKFILEGYDNVAVMSTLDPRQALVQVFIAPGCERMVDEIMTDLGGKLGVVPVDDAQLDDVSDVPCRRPSVGGG
ncbi:DUF4911 domain-containing protein [Desulfosarcina sp.]|uniref:DUF4911 domain-containing protein n=1 Tax=Desulfosarcina sp. TaxID=2027861 RepID=UPI003562AE03